MITSELGIYKIISGAFGAFRKDVTDMVGDLSNFHGFMIKIYHDSIHEHAVIYMNSFEYNVQSRRPLLKIYYQE